MMTEKRLVEIRDYDTCVTLEESAEMAARLLRYDKLHDAAMRPKYSVDDWTIDHSAGRPILLYKKCSVIEAEDAEYLMRLIKRDLGVVI